MLFLPRVLPAECLRELAATGEQGGDAFYKAVLAGQQPAASSGGVDESVLGSCLAACGAVYGEEFGKLPLPQQLGYACDFYNLLEKMFRGNGGQIGDAARLEPDGMAGQLRAFIKLGWARRFPPVNRPPSLLF